MRGEGRKVTDAMILAGLRLWEGSGKLQEHADYEAGFALRGDASARAHDPVANLVRETMELALAAQAGRNEAGKGPSRAHGKRR